MAGFGRYTPGQGFQSVKPGTPSVGGSLGSAIIRGGGGGGGGSNNRAAQEAANKAAAEKAAAEKAAQEKAKADAADKALAEQQKQQQLRLAAKQNILQTAKQAVVSGYDVLSGRAVSYSKLSKEQAELNKRIEAFNIKYGEKSLTPSAAAQAEKESQELSAAQKQIETKKETLVTSKAVRVYNVLNPMDQRLTSAEESKRQAQLIARQEKEVSFAKSKAAETGPLTKGLYTGLATSAEKELERFKAGGKPVVLTGDLPIAPVSALTSKISSVRFAGVEKDIAGGKLITLGYKTTGGGRGVAQTLVKASGEQSISITAGRSGTKAINFPTGTTSISKVKSYVGIEKSLVKESSVALNLKSSGLTASQIIPAQKQYAAGRVLVASGKASPFAKVSKVSDYISISKAVTKGDTSLITGRALTSTGLKSIYGGKIVKLPSENIGKVISGGSRISPVVTTKATQSLISSVAAAEAKVRPLNIARGTLAGIKTTETALSFANIQRIQPLEQKQITKQISRIETKQIPVQLTSEKTYSRSKSIQLISPRQEDRVIQKPIQVPKVDEIQKQIPRQISPQIQSLRQAGISYPIKVTPVKSTKAFGFTLPKAIGGVSKKGIYSVEVRRRGKFFNVGTSRTLGGALELGRSKVSKTLAASFRLTGAGRGLKLPKGFKQSKREKDVFVELPKFRLSKDTEVSEILGYKRRKKR